MRTVLEAFPRGPKKKCGQLLVATECFPHSNYLTIEKFLFFLFHYEGYWTLYNIQRSTLFCANIVKKDLGRARQNSLATARTNFTHHIVPGVTDKSSGGD